MSVARKNEPVDRRGKYILHEGHVEDVYDDWSTPDLIVSDGAYGVGGFPGDPPTPEGLETWYAQHARAWSRRAHRATTLWFWNTEIGWATTHPLLAASGWEHVQTVIWDKGIAHVAGNVNGKTIRRFPTVTEICAFYRRRLTFPATGGGETPAREWLHTEWRRAGLPLHEANEACGVRNAATRKYLTQDWRWYLPPAEMMERLVRYANEHGRPSGRPYYSIDGRNPVTGAQWVGFRHSWRHQHGISNVWTHPPLNGSERYRGNGRRVAPRIHNPGRNSRAHLNQKPLEFMRRILTAASNAGNIVWEPFGGLCTCSVAAVQTGRNAFAAEVDSHFATLAKTRLVEAATAATRSRARPPGREPA